MNCYRLTQAELRDLGPPSQGMTAVRESNSGRHWGVPEKGTDVVGAVAEEPSDIITALAVSQMLGISRAKIYELASAGELPGQRFGNQWRFSRSRIQQLVEGRSPEG